MNENKKIPIRKDRVKELLKRRNMTQIQLAKITGYTKDRINQMLRSGQAIPRAVDMIARVLNVFPEYLTGESNITPADAIKTAEKGEHKNMNNRILHAVDAYRANHYTTAEGKEPSAAAFYPSDVREILNSYCTPAAAVTAALEAGYEIGSRQAETALFRRLTRNADLTRKDLQTVKNILNLTDEDVTALFFAD